MEKSWNNHCGFANRRSSNKKRPIYMGIFRRGLPICKLKQMMESCMVNVHAFSHLSKILKENSLSPLVTWCSGDLEKLQPLSHSKKPRTCTHRQLPTLKWGVSVLFQDTSDKLQHCWLAVEMFRSHRKSCNTSMQTAIIVKMCHHRLVKMERMVSWNEKFLP